MRLSFLPRLPILLLALALPAHAHDYRAGDIAIGHPWARATLPGAEVGGAYMELSNGGTRADRLVGASTPAAASVEFHAMAMEGDVMKMRPLKGGIEVAPGGSVSVAPGGLHLMLVGLNAPLVEGSRVPMTLTFESGGSVEVELAVEAPNARGAAPSEAGHGAAGAMDHGAH